MACPTTPYSNINGIYQNQESPYTPQQYCVIEEIIYLLTEAGEKILQENNEKILV